MNNKGADQTARMHRLICAFVVCIWQKQVFSWRSSYSLSSYFWKLLISDPNCSCVSHSSWAAAWQNQQNDVYPAKTQISLGDLFDFVMLRLSLLIFEKQSCIHVKNCHVQENNGQGEEVGGGCRGKQHLWCSFNISFNIFKSIFSCYF